MTGMAPPFGGYACCATARSGRAMAIEPAMRNRVSMNVLPLDCGSAAAADRIEGVAVDGADVISGLSTPVLISVFELSLNCFCGRRGSARLRSRDGIRCRAP